MENIALITGTAGNLGKAVAKKLLEKEYIVYGTMLHHQQTPSLMEYEKFSRWELDVTDAEACQNFIENIEIDISFAALIVGGFDMGGLAETTLQQLRKMISLNFESTFNMAKVLFNKMKHQGKGGRIVMIGAKPALNPSMGTFSFSYTLSKTLVHHFAEMLNAEGNQYGIVASVVVPSIIDTPNNREAMPEADFDTWATPEEIADVIAYMDAPSASILRDPVMKVYKDA